MMQNYVQGIVDQFKNALEKNTQKLECLDQKLAAILNHHQLSNGKIQEHFVARDANKLQFIKEGTVTENTDIPVREEGGFYPRDGFIANLGEENFKVILFGVESGNQTVAFTVPPNVSIAIRSPISKLTIMPEPNKSAFYQVSVI